MICAHLIIGIEIPQVADEDASLGIPTLKELPGHRNQVLNLWRQHLDATAEVDHLDILLGDNMMI